MKIIIHNKSFLNTCILLAFGLFLTLPLGCQSDFEEVDTIQVKEQNFKTRIIPLSEIANGQNEIKNFIKATNEASSDSRGSIPGAFFDERNIMQVIDSTGIINYSTKFNYVYDPENIFYNLVLNILPNGQKTSYIFKYTCNLQDFQKYKLSNYNYNNFVGTTEIQNYEDPTTQKGTNNKDNRDCPKIKVLSPTPNSGGGSGGGSGSSTLNTTVMGYNVNNHASNFSVSWGGNITYAGGGTSTAGGGSSPHCGCISIGGGLFIFCFGQVIKPHHHKNGNTTGKSDVYDEDCIKNTVPPGLVAANNMVSASFDLKTILNLNRDQYRWLAGKEYIAVDVKIYVLNHWTVEGKAFAVEMINLGISQPNEPFLYFITPPFTWVYNQDDGSLFNDLDPLEEPDFVFDPQDNYETLYPRFTNMVKTLKTFVKNNPKVLSALQTYSGFSKQQILDHLKFGQGPMIKVEEMTGRYGFYNRKNGINTLHIKSSYVRGLEQANLTSTKEATAFLLAVTILHEYVHLGTQHNNISEGVYDFGLGFERDAFNVTVGSDNAGNIVINFNTYF